MCCDHKHEFRIDVIMTIFFRRCNTCKWNVEPPQRTDQDVFTGKKEKAQEEAFKFH